MLKRVLLAVIAVFVAWQVLDLVIHVAILGSTYEATAQLWRPMEEMKRWLMSVVALLAAACFVSIYAYLIQPKSFRNGLLFGLIYGLGAGISMGYGSYSVMAIPYHMALTWFLGSLVEGGVAGILAAAIVKESGRQSQSG